MAKKYLLFAGKEIDTDKQTVAVNQVIQLEGYGYDKYVVYEIAKNQWGITYKLINLHTKEFGTSDLIRPLSEKFGIGHYYDDVNPQFMDAFEVAILLQQAKDKAKVEAEEAAKEKVRIEEIKETGRKRFAEIFPADAQAVIVARLKQDDSDRMTDYYASSTQRTVILGFSTHKRDIFSEMRKYASNFEETAYLTADNKEYEHREKYSMGAGYYLGESKYHGWIIEKVSIYDRNRTIEEFAYTAGDEGNIRVKPAPATASAKQSDEQAETVAGNYTIVDYSEKAVAIFGDTRAIKEQLSALGGRFNMYLTLNRRKCAGWIFQKSKEDDLRQLVNLN